MTYPLIFTPVTKERIWGGNNLKEFYSEINHDQNIGELWTLADHENGESIIRNGIWKGKTLSQIRQKHPNLFPVGPNGRLSLLIKLLDCQADLSIQVHPNDDYAQQYENGENGKTECWYILRAKPGSKVVYGSTLSNAQDFHQAMTEGTIESYMNQVEVETGDFIFVPSGTIHSLGAGLLVAEIQQNSDVTYRVYDWNRMDSNGNRRELHIDKAAIVTKYGNENQPKIQGEIIHQGAVTRTHFVTCPYFSVELIYIQDTWNEYVQGSYSVLLAIDGKGYITTGQDTYTFKAGESVLIPKCCQSFQVMGDVKVLHSYIPE